MSEYLAIELRQADAQALYDLTGTLPHNPDGWTHRVRAVLSEALHEWSENICECGHAAGRHVMFSQTQRCEATVYTDAPLGGGSAYPCRCLQFTKAAS